MERIINEYIGNYFGKLRESQNYTKRDIANILNMSEQTYFCYEKGTRSMPIDIMKRFVTQFVTKATSVTFLYTKKVPLRDFSCRGE